MKTTLLILVGVLYSFSGMAQNVPIDFEAGGNGAGWTWTVVENNTNPPLQIVTNPSTSGINTSSTVAEFTALQSGQPWALTESLNNMDLGSYVLDATNSTITIMVYKSIISDVGIKLVTPTLAAQPEIKVPNTLINQWEEITFDFSGYIGQGAYATENVSQIVVFPDFDLGGRTQDNVCYFDNINFGPQGAAVDLTITTEVCSAASEVRLTGPWWGWNPFGGPSAVDNGNGTWTFTLSPAPTANMEYLLVVDSIQENLIAEMQNGGTCAPVTDFANYANRQWLTTDPIAINNTYGQCAACNPLVDLDITVEICDSVSEVRMTGAFWGWDPMAGPSAIDNGNGTWTFNLSPEPTADMEYLIIADGVQEDLISDMVNGGDCAPVTDYSSYANRLWTVGSGAVTGIVYDRCVACEIDDLIITTEFCDSTLNPSQVSLTGPIWGWDVTAGPQAVDNGDGTWTFTMSPAPADSLEYLLVVDGTTMEDLLAEMINGGTCAPQTDLATYANRLWVNGDGNVDNFYDQCTACSSIGIDDVSFENLSIFPVPASNVINISDESTIGNVVIYSIVGQKVIEVDMASTTGSIAIDDLNSGLYYLTVSREGSSSTHQIVKM
ncbi:MAG: T9SS type A sorting domain-containing protein [Crocinitomicaceae bacterium]|nr:T9SS type A sorting domain-containing protein [Crocinitomicaceae bacterium]MDG1658266.1 T9SS type A sorting domain-containing protein [Crocinitomicaceae bacterium]